VIPLPRASLLAGALLVGTTAGMVAAIAATLFVHVRIRPDVAVALIIGIPCVSGLVVILLSARRWMTVAGAFLLAVGPGWFGMLVVIQAVHGV
jgi:Putative holin